MAAAFALFGSEIRHRRLERWGPGCRHRRSARWWTVLDAIADLSDAAEYEVSWRKNAAGTYQKIINLMPPHEVYIEPFLGSGAILRHRRPARLNVGMDLDRQTVASVSADLAQNGDDRARSRIHVCGECERQRYPLAGKGDAGSGWRFYVGDALKFMASFTPQGNELVYLDPPYLAETRSSGRMYAFEMSDAGHRRLLTLVCQLRCMVMVSGYWSKLYAEALKDWRSVHFPAITRSGRMAEEWVWCNFPVPAVLHDYRYLGENFRERERLKRRINRWRARLARMDQLERQAILCAIKDSPFLEASR